MNVSARTGQTLMRDAYDLLGVKKYETFVKLAEKHWALKQLDAE